MRRALLTLSLLAGASTVVAHAGTITPQTIDVFTFHNATVSDELGYSGTVTGFVSINVTAGTVAMSAYGKGGAYSDFVIDSTGRPDGKHRYRLFQKVLSFDGDDIYLWSDSTSGGATYPNGAANLNGATAVLVLPVTTLVGYTGGNVCSFATLCSFTDHSQEISPYLFDPVFDTGTLDLTSSYTIYVSDTPEPSSLVLLGTGLLGCLGAVRRRLIS